MPNWFNFDIKGSLSHMCLWLRNSLVCIIKFLFHSSQTCVSILIQVRHTFSGNALSYCDQKYPELVTIPSGLISERAYYTCTSDRKYLYPMITYEQDSDIHHWGFDFLHCDLFSVPPYCGGTSQQDSSFYDTSYVGESDIDPECATIENDEIIAHALQEELSQLAVAEASGSTHAEDECLQVSVLTQDWFSPYMRSYSPGTKMTVNMVIDILFGLLDDFSCS